MEYMHGMGQAKDGHLLKSINGRTEMYAGRSLQHGDSLQFLGFECGGPGYEGFVRIERRYGGAKRSSMLDD